VPMPFGIRKLALWALVALFLTLPLCALATEDEAFVNPTRNPNAPKYFSEKPGDLQPDQIVASSFILMERTKKQVLLEKDSEVARFPASTTKILTALMALEFGDLNEYIKMEPEDLDIPKDATRVPFKVDESVALKDMLYGMMLKSGNEAANAVARYLGGDVDTFARWMNDTAAMLGCTSTHFTNANGLHEESHYTTAYDLAVIMDAALDNETFREIIRSPDYDLRATGMNPSRKIENSNVHIRRGEDNKNYYPWSIGGKTGFTTPAGYTLVEAAEKDGVELIAVVMYTSQSGRWEDTKRLFEYGFSKYESITPEQVYKDNPTVLQISGFDPVLEGYSNSSLPEDERQGRLRLDIRPVDPSRTARITDLKPEIETIRQNFSMYTNVRWLKELRAPIEKGEVMGHLTFYPDGEDEVVYELIATRGIPARENAPPTLEEIERRVAEDPSPFPPFGWDWVLPPILSLLAVLAALRALLRAGLRRRRSRKQIPKPKRRYFS